MSAVSNVSIDNRGGLNPPVTAFDGNSKTRPSRLWLWFVVAFLLQVAAWTAWFVIASKHPVQEVPLVPTAR